MKPAAMLKCDGCDGYEAIGDATVTCLTCSDAKAFARNTVIGYHARLRQAAQAVCDNFDPLESHSVDDLRSVLESGL